MPWLPSGILTITGPPGTAHSGHWKARVSPLSGIALQSPSVGASMACASIYTVGIVAYPLT